MRDGIERVKRIQEVREIDTEGGNVSTGNFLDRLQNPPVPTVVHQEVVHNLREFFECEHIFDVYILGVNNLKISAETADVPTMYAYEVLIQSMVRAVERLIDEQKNHATASDDKDTAT